MYSTTEVQITEIYYYYTSFLLQHCASSSCVWMKLTAIHLVLLFLMDKTSKFLSCCFYLFVVVVVLQSKVDVMLRRWGLADTNKLEVIQAKVGRR